MGASTLLLAIAAIATQEAVWPCSDVPTCVVEANRQPETASWHLSWLLSGLPAPVLVRALNPGSSERRLREPLLVAIRGALCRAHGHTRESAGELLTLARVNGDANETRGWLFALAVDGVGRPVLGDFIEATPTGALPLKAAMSYVEGTEGRPRLWDFAWPQPKDVKGARRSSDPADAARAARFASRIWAAYVDARLAADRDDRDPTSPDLLHHIELRAEYDARLGQLIYEDLANGLKPREDELKSYASQIRRNPARTQELLAWAESPNEAIRDKARELLVEHLKDAPINPIDRPRVRRILLALAQERRGSYAESAITELLPEYLDDLTAMEANTIVGLIGSITVTWEGTLASAFDSGAQPRLHLLAQVGERFVAHRAQLARRMTEGPLEMSDYLAGTLKTENLPRLRETIADWVNHLRASDLQDETMQDRLVLLHAFLFASGGALPALELPAKRWTRPKPWAPTWRPPDKSRRGRRALATDDILERVGVTVPVAPPLAELTTEEEHARQRAFAGGLEAMKIALVARGYVEHALPSGPP